MEHRTLAERRAQGKAARVAHPRSAHAIWEPGPKRHDPVDLLEQQNAFRDPDLVPVRHARMSVSPFTFYRGAARIMAADLGSRSNTGLTVQLCGDAHLSNFGVFGSPERALVFDCNDFDETLPGPFEYDLKRLAASCAIAARNNAFSEDAVAGAAWSAARGYHDAIREYASMRTLDLWYARITEEEILQAVRTVDDDAAGGKSRVARTKKAIAKARSRDSLQALSKLGEVADGQLRIVSQPPIVVPAREWNGIYGVDATKVEQVINEQFTRYRASLQHDRRDLLDRYEVVDVARKVVGVGSVGTRAFVILLLGRDEGDPLFLQVKEATRSVLEDHLPRSRFRQPGERVVHGQRMMQAASDIFLGWTKGSEEGRFYYWRQLRDMKGSADIERMDPDGLRLYASVCARSLARAHARSGDAVAIAEYLGRSERFAEVIAKYSLAYAEQNEADYELFMAAIASGRLAAAEG